jgi:hypothetical protein
MSLATLVDIRVGVVIRVPLRAARLHAVDGSWRNRATKKILETSRWVQMSRVDANSIAAQVIKLLASFDRPNKQLVAKPMRAYMATAKADLRIRPPRAGATRSSCPHPARRVVSTVAHLAHRLKTRDDRMKRHSRVSCICLAFSMASLSSRPTARLRFGSRCPIRRGAGRTTTCRRPVADRTSVVHS